VAAGTPFREAHAVVGTLVRASLAPNAPSLAHLVATDGRLGPEAAALLAPGVAVTRRTTPGGGGPDPVARQLERFRQRLDADRVRLH
jgi:argininosuccinate lyase